MADNFVESFMSTFRDKIKAEAEVHMKNGVSMQQNTASLLKGTMDSYTDEQNKLAQRMKQMIDKRETESNQKLKNEIATINDDLFKDPKQLHQKIKKATDDLEKIQKKLVTEKKEWINDDKEIAEWLGRPLTQPKADEKENVRSDFDFITIKVDDRTFRTYRKTLTQIPGSKIAKLFSESCEDKQLLKYDEKLNVYSVNCNPQIFAQVLEILRTKGKAQIKMTLPLHAALTEFGISKTFFASVDADSLAGFESVVSQKKGFHVVFEAFRSTANNSYYPKWNKSILSSDENKEDYVEYWQLNPSDESEIMFLQTGYYRVTFRCAQSYTSHMYAQIYIDGSAYDFNRHYISGAANIRSHYFNEVREFKEGQKLKFYVYPAAAYAEEQSTYLCIERIPDNIMATVGIWKSSATNGHYRQWNSTIKNSDRYKLQSNNKQIWMNKGGLYRVSVRVHSNHSSGPNQLMYLYENRNGTNHTHASYQSTPCTNYKCHMFDEILISKQNDYVHVYDNGHGTASTASYDCIQIQHIPFGDNIGVWKSSSVVSSYQRAWNFEYWCGEVFLLNNEKNMIEVKQAGHYRICCNTTQTQGSNVKGYSALYVNDSQYCLSRMGCQGGTYHTTTIQEIVALKKADRIYIYTSNPYNHKDYNSLFIEKLE